MEKGYTEIIEEYVKQARTRGATEDQIQKLEGFKGFLAARIAQTEKIINGGYEKFKREMED